MTTRLKAVSVNMGNRVVQIQHDGVSQITIFDQPLEEPYEHEKRGTKNEIPLLQNISMMDFQAKIAMLFRGALTHRRLQLPLAGVFEMEIELESLRGPDKLPLLSVMKSVIDGLNKEIIDDDQSIFACSIVYKKSRNIRPLPSKPKDRLSAALFERTGKKRMLIQEVNDVSIYVEPKKEPLFLDYDNDALWTFDVDDQRDRIADALHADGMRISGGRPIKLTMNFKGNVLDKDLDNMAKVYFKLLEKLGLESRNVHRIDLTKEHADKGCTRILLN